MSPGRRIFLTRIATAGLAALFALPAIARAETLLLVTAADRSARGFTRADLDALPQQTIVTSTQWTTGVHKFAGPSLRDVMLAGNIRDGTVLLSALNDYMITIDVAELADTVPIIATRIDGQPFSVRENGPLWVVYPYDSGPQFRTDTTFARSIWQLTSISVEAP